MVYCWVQSVNVIDWNRDPRQYKKYYVVALIKDIQIVYTYIEKGFINGR